jgi:hypothetical protein
VLLFPKKILHCSRSHRKAPRGKFPQKSTAAQAPRHRHCGTPSGKSPIRDPAKNALTKTVRTSRAGEHPRGALQRTQDRQATLRGQACSRGRVPRDTRVPSAQCRRSRSQETSESGDCRVRRLQSPVRRVKQLQTGEPRFLRVSVRVGTISHCSRSRRKALRDKLPRESSAGSGCRGCVLIAVDDRSFHPAQRGDKLLHAVKGPPP